MNYDGLFTKVLIAIEILFTPLFFVLVLTALRDVCDLIKRFLKS